ncbi:MAG: hypothetical protein NW216_00410 [Hyphomicrobium sp.]|nr:hypothetical protein [Hyphomicrobium sp.]
MLDFSRVADVIGSLMGDTQNGPSTGIEALSQAIEASGINPETLQNLSQGEILQVLQDHGIDTTSLGEGQVVELLQQFGMGEWAQSQLSELWRGFDVAGRG